MRREVSSSPGAFNPTAADLFRTVQRGNSQVRGCGLVTLSDSDFFTKRLRPLYYGRISHQQGSGVGAEQYVDLSPASPWSAPHGRQGAAITAPAPKGRG